MARDNISERRAYVQELINGDNLFTPTLVRSVAAQFECSYAAILADVKALTRRVSVGVVYGLTAPNDNRIRYVGRTINPKARYIAHRNASVAAPQLSRWLLALKANGQEPVMVILEAPPVAILAEREQWWINEMARRGYELLNTVVQTR